jgi:SAM-dependent methyltransferase
LDANQTDGAVPATGGLWRRVVGLLPKGKSRRRSSESRSAAPGEFHSADYWEERYKTGGNSGAGSYGNLAAFKAEFINSFIQKHQVSRLLDFGCGDGNQAGFIEVEKYLGIDVSPSALQRCKDKFKGDPRRRFLLYEQATFQKEVAAFQADLAISMDVIFHLVENEVFVKYINELFGAATKHVIIYSTNFERFDPSPHQVDRQFTGYLEREMPGWELIQTLINPYKGKDSRSDFFVYAKKPGLPPSRASG